MIAAAFLSLLLTAAQTPAATTPYFPPAFAKASVNCGLGGQSGKMEILTAFENTWYSRHLGAAEEPSLYLASLSPPPPGVETLRFTWLRSFHAPVDIRIETSGPGRHRLIVKQLSGAGGYDPGTVVKRLDRALTVDEAAQFEAMMTRTRVFDLPPRACDLGLDGAVWLIEAVDTSGYHFVSRQSPDSGKVREVGDFLLKLVGWDFEPIY